tara:strand:- start:280 stop:573 length:294 start_codon:yes stop_codon:yes gene_type:complete
MNNLEKTAIATLLVLGSVAGATAFGVGQSLYDGYFLGREKKKGVTYKTIAKRNAVLGGVFGAVGAGLFFAAPSSTVNGHNQSIRGVPYRGVVHNRMY